MHEVLTGTLCGLLLTLYWGILHKKQRHDRSQQWFTGHLHRGSFRTPPIFRVVLIPDCHKVDGTVPRVQQHPSRFLEYQGPPPSPEPFTIWSQRPNHGRNHSRSGGRGPLETTPTAPGAIHTPGSKEDICYSKQATIVSRHSPCVGPLESTRRR